MPKFEVQKENPIESLFRKKTKKKKKKFRLPAVLDLVTDSVRFRFFSSILFLLVLLNASSIINQILGTNFKYAENLPTKMTFKSFPPFEINYAEDVKSPTIIRISSKNDQGSSGKEIVLYPHYYDGSTTFLQGKTLDEYQLDDVKKIIITGEEQGAMGEITKKADSDGFADFSKMKISGGPTGIIILPFVHSDDLQTYFPLFAFSRVNKIKNLTAPPTAITGYSDEEFGKPLSVQPKFQIFDKNGDPSAGHFITISNFETQPIDYPIYDRFVLLDNNIAGPSDSDGIVEFTDLTIIGGTTSYHFLSAYCENDLTKSSGTEWVDYNYGKQGDDTFIEPIKLKTQVSQVAIVQQPSGTIEEGKPFDVQPTIRVTDSHGDPLKGKTIIARLKISGKDDLNEYRQQIGWKTKYLLNSVSGKTDSKGEVTFDDLRFSYTGLTIKGWEEYIFKMKFICDGIGSELSDPILIESIVANITVLSSPTKINPLENWYLYHEQSRTEPYGLISPSISLKIIDANGMGVPSKLVKLFAFPTTSNSFSFSPAILISDEVKRSDLDGIVSFPNSKIISLNDSTIDQINFFLYVDDYLFKINQEPIAIELGDNEAERCSQIWVNRTHIPVYLMDPKYKVGTEPFNLTVRVMDYKGRGLSGMQVKLGNHLQVLTYDEFPVNYGYPVQAQDLTDEDGYATFQDFRWYGYNSTIDQVIIAYNPNLQPQLENSKFGYDCYYWFNVQIEANIKQVEIFNFPDSDEKAYYPFETFNDTIQVKITDHNDQPVPDFQGSLILAHFPHYLNYYGITDLYGPSDNLIDAENQLDIFELMQIYQSNTRSDENGIITFDEFYFNYPGEYAFVFRVGGIVSRLSKILKVSAHVSQLEIVQQPQYDGGDTPITSGLQFDSQPIIRLLDSNGQPVEGYMVLAEAYTQHAIITSENNELFGSLSEISNSSGYAHFTDLKFSYINQDGDYQIQFRLIQGNEKNDEIDLLIRSDAIPCATTKGLIYVSSVPKTAVPGKSLPTIPIIYAQNLNGDALTGRNVGIVLFEAPVKDKEINLTSYDVFENFYNKTDDGGKAYFSDLVFKENSPLGTYVIKFVLDSMASDPFEIDLNQNTSSIKIVIQPPESVVVGKPFLKTNQSFTYHGVTIIGQLSVQILDNSGVPLENKIVLAKIGKSPENFWNKLDLLEDTRQTSTTNSLGIAEFDLKLIAGMSGEYTIIFQSDSSFSEDTNTFLVTNLIDEIKILRQPQNDPDWQDYDHESEEGKSRLTQTNTLSEPYTLVNDSIFIQPKVQLIGEESMAGKTVYVRSSSGSQLQNNKVVTNKDGIAEFVDLKFTVANTGDYSLIFYSEGIDSPESKKIKIFNPNDSDLQSVSSIKIIIIISSILTALVFCVNSYYQKSKYVYILAILISLLLFAEGILYISLNNDGYKNPFTVIVYVVTTFCLLSPFFIIVSIILLNFKKKYNFYFHKTKLNSWLDLATRLLPVGSVKYFKILQIKNKLDFNLNHLNNLKKNKLKEKDYISNSGSRSRSRSRSGSNSSSDPDFGSNSGSGTELDTKGNQSEKIDIQNIKSIDELNNNQMKYFAKTILHLNNNNEDDENNKENDNDKYKEEEDEDEKKIKLNKKQKIIQIFKKIKSLKKKKNQLTRNSHQQYQLTTDFYYPQRLFLALILSLVFAVFIILLSIKGIQYFSFQLQTWRQELLEFQCHFDGYSSLLISQETNEDKSLFLTNVESFFGKTLPTSTNDFLPTSFLSVFSWLESLDKETIDEMTLKMMISTTISAGIAIVLVLVLWYKIFTNYKKRIFLLRQGKNPFNYQMGQVKILYASHYVGIQGWLAGIGFILVWFLSVLVIFIVIFSITQTFFASFAKTLLLGMAGSVLIKIVVVQFVKRVFIKKGRVIYRRWFSLFDLIWIVVNLATSITTAIIRIIEVMLLYFITFIRIDIAPVSRFIHRFDFGFNCYLAMLKLDHQSNNPIVTVFVHFLLKNWLKSDHNLDLIKNESQLKNSQSIEQNENDRFYKEKEKEKENDTMEIEIQNESTQLQKKKLLNKWWLLTTLHNNSNFMKYRMKTFKTENQNFNKKVIPDNPQSSKSSDESDTSSIDDSTNTTNDELEK
ncbi:hypothetical protein M0813_02731 [Anaeramoeba flamelloides]|uniref:Uncharacterized protein n=1 Tax=Anaeramoeba flamelloides TaxID=1746091 RepID=A0ABQ8YE62_9EUKA|nr:hypothetical protein M0813_02731 [Anaeramoeba flamelloides]